MNRPEFDQYTAVDLETTKMNINYSNRKKLPETDMEIIIAEGVDVEAEPEQ